MKRIRQSLPVLLSAVVLVWAMCMARPMYTLAAAASEGKHTPPPEAELPADSLILTHEVMPDTWVFTDGLGRVSLTNADVGDPREDKTVAMYFWTWHNKWKHIAPWNKTEILEQYPEAVNDYDHPAWNGAPGALFWNEPIWGYYGNDDKWVARRQAELLTNAGVDTIITDPERSGYFDVLEAWAEAKADGLDTPKMAFIRLAGSKTIADSLRMLYTDLYRNQKYADQWFYWEGKPFIMAGVDQCGLSESDSIDREILNFFSFRKAIPGYGSGTGEKTFDAWSWLSVMPQPYYYASRSDYQKGIVEQVTVGVAVNYNYELNMISAMNGEHIMGRSYTTDYENRYEVEGKEASKWGYHFGEQWQYALELDPKLVFITSWNEWISGRYPSWPGNSPASVENGFPDQGDDEFSRDIEPSKGALKDHYYYQLVNNVRRYKGVRPIPTPSEKATVDISADNTQWTNIAPYYASYIGNTDDRDAVGYGQKQYADFSGRNDIIGSRVARDRSYVYFYVECNEDITPYTDPLWMNLYIDSDQENAGWNSFDYVLNKTAPTADKATLEKFTGDGYNTEVVGEVDYTVSGKYMQVKIPKAMLGLEGYDFTINFTWTDNVHDASNAGPAYERDFVYTQFTGDIMDFYTSGDVAPGGRFKFSYVSTTENAGGADPAGAGDGESTDSSTDSAQTNGCASSVGVAAVLMTVAAVATAVVVRKREHGLYE